MYFVSCILCVCVATNLIQGSVYTKCVYIFYMTNVIFIFFNFYQGAQFYRQPLELTNTTDSKFDKLMHDMSMYTWFINSNYHSDDIRCMMYDIWCCLMLPNVCKIEIKTPLINFNMNSFTGGGKQKGKYHRSNFCFDFFENMVKHENLFPRFFYGCHAFEI